MPLIKLPCALAVLFALGPHCASAQPAFGPAAAEDSPCRRQQWLLPSPEPTAPAHALLFRPPGDGPFPLALVAHESTHNALRRAQMPQPEYRALAAYLVARGYAVLVPERPGHGATGLVYREDQGSCDAPDYSRAGRANAASIPAALTFMRGQSFIRRDGILVVGHSAGGWGALAADGARVPVTWPVADNDTYFAPSLSRRLAAAFAEAGGRVDFRVLPPCGSEGHWLAEGEEGVKRVAGELDRALKRSRGAASVQR